MPTTIGDFVYFKLVYDYLEDKISEFGMDLMGRAMAWASGIALVLVTLWIMIQGYRILTGQSRESMMAMVTHMTRVVIIVTAATTMSIFGSDLHRFLTVDLGKEINHVLTGSDDTPGSMFHSSPKPAMYFDAVVSAFTVVMIEPSLPLSLFDIVPR